MRTYLCLTDHRRDDPKRPVCNNEGMPYMSKLIYSAIYNKSLCLDMVQSNILVDGITYYYVV